MKRFEYIHVFKDKENDAELVTFWLDSFKECKEKFPYEFLKSSVFIETKRTGRKFRSPMLTIKIKLYKLLKSI